MLVFSLWLMAFRNSNGVLQPFKELGWWRWMYRLSPYTYLVEALMGNGKRLFHARYFSNHSLNSMWYLGLGGQEVTCSDIEYATINPPAGLTCSQYMDPYIASSGGYLTNPDSTTACQFCSLRTTDELLDLSFNIKYSNRWRDVGIFIAFIAFNVCDSLLYVASCLTLLFCCCRLL